MDELEADATYIEREYLQREYDPLAIRKAHVSFAAKSVASIISKVFPDIKEMQTAKAKFYEDGKKRYGKNAGRGHAKPFSP